jgi:predicted amidohydrolase
VKKKKKWHVCHYRYFLARRREMDSNSTEYNMSLPLYCYCYRYYYYFMIARAIESQCYVLAAAQYGKHNAKRESFGHALAVDPWGKVVGDAGGYPFEGDGDDNNTDDVEEPPTIIICEIDVDQIESVRERLPIELHRSNAPISL